MTDDKGVVRAYSQDRRIYRHNSISSKRKSLAQFPRTSENYHYNRNCPEILSILALQSRHLQHREKQISHSVSNDEHYFNMINYPIQSPTPTPISSLVLETINQEEKEIKFPKLASRSGKQFPTLTPRNTSTVNNKSLMPVIKSSMKSVSSSFTNSPQNKMPTVSNEKKTTKTQLTHFSRRAEWH